MEHHLRVDHLQRCEGYEAREIKYRAPAMRYQPSRKNPTSLPSLPCSPFRLVEDVAGIYFKDPKLASRDPQGPHAAGQSGNYFNGSPPQVYAKVRSGRVSP